MTIKTKNNNDIEIKDIRWFGTEIKRIYKKDGNFKNFITYYWIRTYKGELYYVDTSIGKLKKLFNNYDSYKKEIKEWKGSKIKKVYEWNCEVINEKNEKKIKDNQINIVKDAIENHKPFSLDGQFLYYFVEGFIYKNSKNNELVYMDIDKRLITPIDIDFPYNREELNKWIEAYENKRTA